MYTRPLSMRDLQLNFFSTRVQILTQTQPKLNPIQPHMHLTMKTLKLIESFNPNPTQPNPLCSSLNIGLYFTLTTIVLNVSKKLKFQATRIWSIGVWAGSVARIFILFYIIFFHFLRGHQELFVNTLHAIFGDIMSMW